ncbi:protein DUF642 L-GALACTONO-1,4-LACTONE-RESPONSIVE GENE 2-like [Magnolia sinica]|uniref:protein DUF642 L-GALACTONO-1,4-LACTONE-RESPONSIVE GENE 2-like n=1 Tax=Magnolia sinica TaxID=86752 RepID=UPI002659AEA2|nr:protein DUF642 L-GALACTONO-1,4-LACTONE-RESPONSIVE GENE 2-like [Magnolia sinica]
MARLSTRRSWMYISLLVIARLSVAFADDGLLSNGDFETPPSDGFKEGVLGEGGPTTIPGWNSNGTVELVESGQKQGGMLLIVPQGLHAVRLGNNAEVSQDIKVEKGSTYAITFSAARTCAQLESLNVSVHPASQTIDLQTLYSVEGWDSYAWAFQAESDDGRVAFKNTGMEDDPTCGPILDNIAIKKLFTPDKPKDNAVINGDFEEGPWMFQNTSLGVLLPTNLDEETSSLPGWIVESNRAVRYIDSNHYEVPQGKRAVELLSGKEGIISQMVETTPEKQYQLSFSLGQAGDSCQRPLAVMAFAGDQAENIHYSPIGNMTHQPANLTFKARAERTRVAFYSVYYNTRTDDKSSLCGPVVDEVRVWVVSGSTKVWTRLGPGLLGMVLVLALI